MIPVKKKARSILKSHGGKHYLARRIIELMPRHTNYLEPFFGSGAVLLNKPPCDAEFAGDTNKAIMLAWSMVAKTPDVAKEKLAAIPYTEESFKKAKEATVRLSDPIDTEQVVACIVRNRMSRDGLGKDFAWSDRTRGGKPGEVNAWENMIASIDAIHERVKNVEWINNDFRWQLNGWRESERDAPDSLVYCDPPYLHETRVSKRSYGPHEMSMEDHIELLAILRRLKSKVILSGYASGVYSECLSGWRTYRFEMPNHSAQTKQKSRREECLWLNW